MRIVIDSNVLFSALIRNSKTRKLILEYEGFFLFPEYIFTEMQNHKQELLDKSGMNKTDFDKLLFLILRRVIIVSNKALKSFKKESINIMKNIDIDDAVFIACALAYEDSIVWSDDKALKKQNTVKVLNTKEIVEILEKSKK